MEPSVPLLGSNSLLSPSSPQLPQRIAPAALPTGGVYLLTNPDGKAVRIGRTIDLERRQGEYSRDPNYFDLDFMDVYRTNDYATQRGLEQFLYDQYHPPLNVIKPISPTNGNINNYMNAAYNFLVDILYFGH